MVETIVRKKDGKKVGRIQYVAEAIARSNQQFPTAWKSYEKEAKAAVRALDYFDEQLAQERVNEWARV